MTIEPAQRPIGHRACSEITGADLWEGSNERPRVQIGLTPAQAFAPTTRRGSDFRARNLQCTVPVALRRSALRRAALRRCAPAADLPKGSNRRPETAAPPYLACQPQRRGQTSLQLSVAPGLTRGLPPCHLYTRGGLAAATQVRQLWAGIRQDPPSVTGSPGPARPGRRRGRRLPPHPSSASSRGRRLSVRASPRRRACVRRV